jgi:hypothetical protein
MTPIRFAAFVLTVALLLPISPEAKAITVLPDAPHFAATSLALNPLPGTTTETPATMSAEATTPSAPLMGRHKVRCGCLYLDWWYDTPGMWVSVETDNLPEI